jgi:hypothetical protein
MATWKCTNKTVTKEEVEKSLESVKSACFGCETHSNECSIAKAAGEIAAMMETEKCCGCNC